ncbi:MAG: hypothetical protein HY340_02145 [Candidatus Kerfeldbacteria bacterium]|nr:hypothetical protein [Candidatus Kerfeldbacteria bacterium]
MIAQCVRVEYVHGSYDCRTSHKYLDGPHMLSRGERYQSRGSGWWDVWTPSKLILHITVDGEPFEVWIDHFFKRTVGRLTSKRRDRIVATMPPTIEVVPQTGKTGRRYYTVPDPALNAWLDRTGLGVGQLL